MCAYHTPKKLTLPVPVTEDAKARVQQIVAAMSLDEKIGQVMLPDFRSWIAQGEQQNMQALYETWWAHNRDMVSSNEKEMCTLPEPAALTEMNDEVRQVIREFHIGNVLLFSDNCTDTAKLTRMIYEFQKTAIENGDLPLVIGIDQEGGNTVRLCSGTCLSGNMAIGFSGKTENAYLAGKVLGSELHAVLANCDFAPVADVNSNPDNPIIGVRSFSDDPLVTAEMACAMSEGILAEGVIACAKHFPGHGDTATDSHTGLPMVPVSREVWEKREALPFDVLVKAGIPMIMTAHIQVPALDDTKVRSKTSGESIYLPATLSKRILTNILKEEMGFEGVIVTDALNMDAISMNFGESEAVIMALQAGADMVCMPVILRSLPDLQKMRDLYAAIKAALASGALPMERLNDAVTRVVTMKLTSGILDMVLPEDITVAMANAVNVVGGAENRAIERQLAQEGIQLRGTFTPFDARRKVVFFMPYENECNSVRHALWQLRQEGKLVNAEVTCYNQQRELTADMQEAIASADYIVVGSEQQADTIHLHDHWLYTMPRIILDAAGAKQKAVLCTGLPYQADTFAKDIPCFLLANHFGMQAEDVGKTTYANKYGPAIPAAVARLYAAD